jgi:hypothetical protein
MALDFRSQEFGCMKCCREYAYELERTKLKLHEGEDRK